MSSFNWEPLAVYFRLIKQVWKVNKKKFKHLSFVTWVTLLILDKYSKN